MINLNIILGNGRVNVGNSYSPYDCYSGVPMCSGYNPFGASIMMGSSGMGSGYGYSSFGCSPEMGFGYGMGAGYDYPVFGTMGMGYGMDYGMGYGMDYGMGYPGGGFGHHHHCHGGSSFADGFMTVMGLGVLTAGIASLFGGRQSQPQVIMPNEYSESEVTPLKAYQQPQVKSEPAAVTKTVAPQTSVAPKTSAGNKDELSDYYRELRPELYGLTASSALKNKSNPAVKAEVVDTKAQEKAAKAEEKAQQKTAKETLKAVKKEIEAQSNKSIKVEEVKDYTPQIPFISVGTKSTAPGYTPVVLGTPGN